VITEPAAVAKSAATSEPAREVAASVAQSDNQSSAPKAADAPAPRQSRKNARGRRSSVPSWDEIMLGSSRQQD
jgi:hypothetical protein